MMNITRIIMACLMLLGSAGYAAEQNVSADALVGMMKQARYSDGFEARMNVLITRANGAHPAPFKLAVIGQFSAERQRLLIKGISPEAVRSHVYAAESGAKLKTRTVEASSQSPNGQVKYDPFVGMFHSGLVVWDMFSPWWDWAGQSLGRIEKVNGRECELVLSTLDDKNSTVQEVESCVDQRAKISLRTRIYDASHKLMRTTEVLQLARMGDGAAMVAKKLKISDADKMISEIEVYAGDEHYQISADTFAMLERSGQRSQQELK